MPARFFFCADRRKISCRMFYFVLLEILRFAQDDKLGFVGVIYTVGRGLAPAAGFDVY